MDAKRTVRCRQMFKDFTDITAEELEYRPSVYGVIVQDGKVLLSRQWDGYDFPGGGIEKGERILDALVREVSEETGLSVKPGRLLYVCDDFFISVRRQRKLHSICIYYTCKNPVGEISTAGFQEGEKEYLQAAEWVPLDKIQELTFYNPVDSVALIKSASSVSEV